MFLLYIIWGFFYILLDFTHVFIERNFLKNNNPFLVRKRTFQFISYFEKLFLVLFYRRGWFEYSIANLFRKKDIVEYRRKFYPTIYSFHINHDMVEYDFEEIGLKFLAKQYNYYHKSKFYRKKLIKVFNSCFKFNKKNFIKFSMLQYMYINKYYNFNNFFFYNDKSNLNLVKFNRISNIALFRAKKKLVFFDLNKWYDWYNFNFSKNIYQYCNIKPKLSKKEAARIKEFKLKKFFKMVNIVFKYKKRIIKINEFFGKKFKGILNFRLNFNTFFKIKIQKDFKLLLKYYVIKFSESSITKHINSGSLKNTNIYYLRKNRIFNKGRYSRNRQLYRTGVYWCLWLNIIMVYGLYFIFYRFSFNFGYFWWGLLFIAYSTIFSRIIKYNFFNINYLYKEFLELFAWYGFIIFNFYQLVESTFKNYFYNVNIFNYIAKYKIDSFNLFYDNYYFYIIKYVKKWVNGRKKIKMVYIWQGMKEKDTSFLRYKTVLHWIKEIYRLIVT